MKAILYTLFILIFTGVAQAGDNGGGTINCTSGTGRTKLVGSGVADYNGRGELALKLTIDNKSLDLGRGQSNTGTDLMSLGATVFNPNLKVYTATVSYVGQSGQYNYVVKVLELMAVPGSMKSSQTNSKYTFSAVLRAIDPRKDHSEFPQFFDGDIQLTCIMDLSV